jgi:two-component system, OmpR family, phosphate regulon sensor histidine kinase PhoR
VPVERLLNGQVTPLRPKASDTDGPALLLVLRDLTEQDQLTRLRADFVANASHELRTPLASLKGYVETLQGAAKDDPVARAKFLAIMLAQADRMSRLIEDLLSLSRIEMREHVPPHDKVDLAGLVMEVAGTCRPLAEAANCSLVVTPLPSTAIVVGDRDELLQVAHNLIQNAIKYGRPGGRIEVAITDLDARISLSVIDDGIGIAAQHLPRLTERFYRVSAKDSRERGGTGLGLAIVKHIINRHRGELQITSRMGQGSEFVVLLPRA